MFGRQAQNAGRQRPRLVASGSDEPEQELAEEWLEDLRKHA